MEVVYVLCLCGNNKSKPDIFWFQKYGFVIEDLLNIWNIEVLLAWGLDRNREKLTGYIFAKVLIYSSLKATSLFYIFSIFMETEICAKYKYQVIVQMINREYPMSEFPSKLSLISVLRPRYF